MSSPTEAPAPAVATETPALDIPDMDFDTEMEEIRRMISAENAQPAGEAAADATRDERDRRSIYVGNVDWSAEAKDVASLFAPCGKIVGARIMSHPDGTPKGFAYIECESQAVAEKCVAYAEATDLMLNDRRVKVALKRKNLPGMSKTARGRGRGAIAGTARGTPMMMPFMGSMGMGGRGMQTPMIMMPVPMNMLGMGMGGMGMPFGMQNQMGGGGGRGRFGGGRGRGRGGGGGQY